MLRSNLIKLFVPCTTILPKNMNALKANTADPRLKVIASKAGLHIRIAALNGDHYLSQTQIESQFTKKECLSVKISN